MKRFNLSGQWHIESLDGEYNLMGEVPGSLFHALEQRGDFGSEGIFYRENNVKCLEIAHRDFIYWREFNLDKSFLELENIFLEAEGLDTLTEIRINSKIIGQTENMHRTWKFNISSHLKSGANKIEILFKDSLKYITEERQRRRLFSADNGGITSVEGFNMIRKSHCSYGWDWGPKIPDLGIWRNISIASYDSAKIKSIHITQLHQDDRVMLQIEPQIEQFSQDELTLLMKIKSPDGELMEQLIALWEKSAFSLDNPQLWWPNGLGDQPLYELDFSLRNGEKVIDRLSMRIGLRTLTIEQSDDPWGQTFNFQCNGLSLFARGANYIPEDALLTRKEGYTTEGLVKDCVAANFNTIRVWGGGVYPSDEFYDLCDEMGLIIWQDMMFACALYDVDNPSFLENIQQELIDNLTRMRHHPSIGLICGNNEMEMAFEDWGINPTNQERFEYLKQYQIEFPRIVEKICPEHFYWPASPSSGGNFESPNDPSMGDCHYWDVWHGNKDFSEFKKHYFRFMSEFGFESFPSMKTIESFTEEHDRNIFSPVMEEHQKCVGGNGKILTYISKYFKYPKDLESLVYVSQLSQADAITTGINHWRRNRGRCMGSTYWQLNDNWPVASWSSVDYYGRWKALHYAVKRSYDNILLSLDGHGNQVDIHLSNESRYQVSGRIEWSLNNLDGDTIEKGELTAEVNPLSSELIKSLNLGKHIKGNMKRDVYLSTTFISQDYREYRVFHFFNPFKYLNLKAPQINAELKKVDGDMIMTVQSKYPALYVELDFSHMDSNFSDNFFHLNGGEQRVIQVYNDELTLESAKKQLRIKSLYDSY